MLLLRLVVSQKADSLLSEIAGKMLVNASKMIVMVRQAALAADPGR